ncbi:uromodulin-like isoform X1 [Oculina patagonica]
MGSFSFFDIFFLLFFLTADVTGQDDTCRQLEFRAALSFHGKRLMNHVIRTVESFVNNFCGVLCFTEPNCVSYNMEVISGSPSITKCELNNSTHNEHPDDLKPWQNYIYQGTMNACSEMPCQNNAICQAGFTDKGYRCVCAAGLTGQDCTEDIDECIAATHKCPANADCVNIHGSYNCTCKSGYTGDGLNCTDIDECAAPVDPCSAVANSACKNTNGSYVCECKDGFVKNGPNCEDVDECAAPVDPCNVVANSACNNNVGSYNCQCNYGFINNGANCEDVDECTGGAHNCPANADCVNNHGSYTCTCKSGYTGDGHNCADIDECAAQVNPCDAVANSACNNTYGSYICQCIDGFIKNGPNCEADDCQNYQTLSDAERKHDYATVWPNQCDSNLQVGWYRFDGAAGTQMATTCPSQSRCDATVPGWLDGAHPTVAEGMVARTVCINKYANCCYTAFSIQVKNCGSYYIYKLVPTPGCDIRYCSTD